MYRSKNKLIIDKNKIIKDNIIFNKNKNLISNSTDYMNPLILAIIDIKKYKIIKKTILHKDSLIEDGVTYIKYFLKCKR